MIHELQNHLHSATMEVELAHLGVAAELDPVKLLRILDSLKRSLQALRNYVFPSEELTREDPTALLNTVLGEVDKKLLGDKIKLRLRQRGPMPAVELNKECARNAFERLLRHCSRRLGGGGDLQIETGTKVQGGHQFAEIAATLIPSNFEDHANHYCRSLVNDMDMDLILASEILKRYGTGISLERNDKKQVRITVMLNSAREYKQKK
ncbi:MAG TPA: hypothetical protein VMO00_05600 [Methylomirabilota bacterium]|nr:hypothetical protein [Methylomirabilota bacterium]